MKQDPSINYRFSLRMKVRDYECDLQGIVNNANYQHYTEHTRHEFLLQQGVSFAGLHQQGIDAVVARINMTFRKPLHSGDEFLSCLNVTKEGVKYMFYQDIYRLPDFELSNRAVVTAVCVDNGKLIAGLPQLDDIVNSGTK